jgi:hypothetical protein
MSTILWFKGSEDVLEPRPWPVVINDEGHATSGLGHSDGAKLIGYGPFGEPAITVLPEDATATNVIGLSPTFSDGKKFFVWALEIAGVVTR